MPTQLSSFDISRDALRRSPDIAALLELLESLDAHPLREAREFFDKGSELFVARAPGRLDVMGGIADYSGSLVLELPLAVATFAVLQHDATRQIKILSLSSDAQRSLMFEMSLEDFERDGKALDYAFARALFQADPAQHWAAYVAGAFLVLMRERGEQFKTGARILLVSNIPEGKGVSSSAALEVATMSAIAAAYRITISPRDLAVLCQKIENDIVGAPCGVMDQMTSACGAEGELLALLCQPAELQQRIALPADLRVWGLDSGVRHSISGGDYGSVRVGAFMGYRMIADLAGLKVEADGPKVRIADNRWRGYLANIAPSEFETLFAAHLPEQMKGSEFLKRYHGTTDAVTRVEKQRTYLVLKPTAHAIYENFRVRAFAELLQGAARESRNELLGELMYQSHASYASCGLDSVGTDLLVNLAREIGVKGGLYGAKITGGGSGGTIAVLGRSGAEAAIQRIIDSYREATNYVPQLFAGSSAGSAAFGYLKLHRSNEILSDDSRP